MVADGTILVNQYSDYLMCNKRNAMSEQISAESEYL